MINFRRPWYAWVRVLCIENQRMEKLLAFGIWIASISNGKLVFMQIVVFFRCHAYGSYLITAFDHVNSCQLRAVWCSSASATWHAFECARRVRRVHRPKLICSNDFWFCVAVDDDIKNLRFTQSWHFTRCRCQIRKTKIPLGFRLRGRNARVTSRKPRSIEKRWQIKTKCDTLRWHQKNKCGRPPFRPRSPQHMRRMQFVKSKLKLCTRCGRVFCRRILIFYSILWPGPQPSSFQLLYSTMDHSTEEPNGEYCRKIKCAPKSDNLIVFGSALASTVALLAAGISKRDINARFGPFYCIPNSGHYPSNNSSSSSSR